jgi:hypothetical protein
MKTACLATLFFSLTVSLASVAANDGSQQLSLDKLQKLAPVIPCLQPLLLLLPEFVTYRELVAKSKEREGAYFIDHAHHSFYLPQHIVEQIPFLRAAQNFESAQQKVDEKSVITIKLHHPELEVSLLSWLSEAIEQDLHKVDKKAQIAALVNKKWLPSKAATEAIRTKLSLPDFADAIDKARRNKINTKKEKLKKDAFTKTWEVAGIINVIKSDLDSCFVSAPYRTYETNDINIAGAAVYFLFQENNGNLGIYLKSRVPNVFLEWTAEFEGKSLVNEVRQYSESGWGRASVMSIKDLASIFKPTLILSFRIKRIMD